MVCTGLKSGLSWFMGHTYIIVALVLEGAASGKLAE